MASVRPARPRKPPARGAAAPATAASPARVGSRRSPVFVGLSAILLAVPMAVLGGAAGPYDDPKAWALPLLVAATALAWLARVPARAEGARGPRDRPTRLLRWAILAYLLWSLITTVTSIAPGQSVLGSFGRGMGLLVVGSAALLFFLVGWECRTPESIRRLIDTALLGSVPVCVLALGQAIGWDPLPKSWDPAVAALTVRSTLGQHIFLSSYLVVLVPLAAGRLGSSSKRWRAAEPGAASMPSGPWLPGALWVAGALGLVTLAAHWAPAWWALAPWGLVGAIAMAVPRDPIRGRAAVGAAFLGAVTVAQILVVVLSRARGPLLGMLFGLSVAGLALLVRRRAWKAVAVSGTGVGVLVIALVLLNVSHSPLQPLARVGVLSRLAKLTDVRRGTPVWFRLQVWDSILSGWGRQLRGEEVIPRTRPWVRSALGYGLETQLLTLNIFSLPSLGVLVADGEGWRGQYLVDRAHNMLLDHLVTGGLIGAGLWVALAGSLLVVGISRVRSAASEEEAGIRLGCLGAVLAHLAEGQVGIVTTMPLALFWVAAAALASPPWADAGVAESSTPRPGARLLRRSWWIAALIALALAAVLVAWVSTRWLLASAAYAEGTRRHIAGRMEEAYADFRRSRELAPWLPLPAEAFAYTSMRLAGTESSPGRRLSLLAEGESALEEARRHALGGPASWTLTAQITFAEARAGERSKLPVSLEAFENAARLRPSDPQLMAQWAWAWLESGDAGRARQAAERAVALSPGRRGWLGWAVLARAAWELGDDATARRARRSARLLAPPEARRLLEGLLP